MAATKKEQKEEMVMIRLFKDANKYKDDVTVCVNGKVWRIQRGVNVEVPKYVADVLERSQDQDTQTANLINEQQIEYDAMAKLLDI